MNEDFAEVTCQDRVDGRYLVRREIARGGHGAVFEAEHLVTGARVALKALLQSTVRSPIAQVRLRREGRILGSIRHPCVVTVYDAGTCARHGPFIALEMVEGRPLDGILLTRRQLELPRTVQLLIALCDALGVVHRAGIVHRDIKPHNVLIGEGGPGDLKLIDFGVACSEQLEEESADVGASSSGDGKLTRVGEMLGTLDYMAPEQMGDAHSVDVRADVYSLGVLFFECLTGDVPFRGTPAAMLSAMIDDKADELLRARRPDLPREVGAIVKRALQFEAARRFQSAYELAQSLRLLVEEGPREASEGGWSMPRALVRPRATTPPGASRGVEGAAASRRQHRRAPYVTPVRIRCGVDVADGRSEDISEGGLLAITSCPCADGERVQVRFSLPISGRLVELPGVTRWVKADRGRRAVGVELDAMPEPARAEIGRYVALMSRKPR